MALAALDDMLAWIKDGGEVGIYDATDSTKERRALVRSRCEAAGVEVVFIESICDDESIIEANILGTKARSPDYAGIGEGEATEDFRMRIAHYERAYESVDESEGSFIKTVDVGRKIETNKIEGYLTARVVYFLINTHVQQRSIWMTRHGESEFNVLGRIGGDAALSPTGALYADTLAAYVRDHLGAPVLWTSTLQRTTETATHLGLPYREWRALDEIDAGVCDGMTYDEIAEGLPQEFAARAADKFRYRYPRGESYQDVIQRLEPVILEIERERAPLLIIGHQAVLRALYAYMMDEPPDACPRIPVPLHTLIKLTPTAYGCEEERVPLPPVPQDPEGFRQQ
jgi:broad specificity phosphatase PhoE